MRWRGLVVTVAVAGLAAGLLTAPAAHADQILLGAGFGTQPGQPDYEQDRLALFGGYELDAGWRFSYTDARFEHEDSDDKLSTELFAVERTWTYEMGSNLNLLASMGPGLYRTRVEVGEEEESGNALGLLAGLDFRIWFGDGFAQVGYHYRNGAVAMDDFVVDGGYSGIAFGGGVRL